MQGYHDIFPGLRKLPSSYHFDMDPNTKPVQENSWHVPIPVKDERKNKIEELETIGLIAHFAQGNEASFNQLIIAKKASNLVK